jgi:hypothetical protein
MILWTNAAINMAVSIPVIFLGLLAARKLGMGAPVLESLLYSKPVLPGSLRTLVLLAPLSGLAVGGALTAMDLAFHRLIPEGFAALEAASQGMTSLHPLAAIAATLYGGIYEELQLRLFVLSSMAWLYTLVLRKIQRQPFYPSSTVTTVAVVLAALMFGLAHLPALQALQAATGPMIIRTMILNLVPGLLFGFLYVKKGLEAAMISHLCADLVMHVFLPFMEGRFA